MRVEQPSARRHVLPPPTAPSAGPAPTASEANAAHRAGADTFTPAGPAQPQTFSGESSASASSEVSADGASVEASAGAEVKGPKGIGVSFEVSASASVQSDVTSEGGFTTYTVTTDASVTVSGEVDAGSVGFGANQTEGVKATYQVRMTDADYQRMQNGEIPPPDPFHPETMPEGTKIIMDSADYENTGFSASFNQISASSNVSSSEGSSVVIEARAGNEFTVTAGPTSAVENSFQLGLDLGLASAHIGKSTSLEGFTLNTATFDLDTEEGAGGYNEFLVTGQFPSDNGTGISEVAKIEQVVYSSTSSIGGSLGPFEGVLELGSSSLNQVKTTFPDGTSTQVTDLKLHGGVPVQLEQAFNADGTEDLSQQKFSMTLTDFDDDLGAYLIAAFTGEEDHSAAKAQLKGDKELVLTFTADQSAELSARAQAYFDANEAAPHEAGTYFLELLANADNAAEVADAFARGWTAGMSEELLSLVFAQSEGSELDPLPGDLQVV